MDEIGRRTEEGPQKPTGPPNGGPEAFPASLREREVAVRERELAFKERDLLRSRWSNPLTIGLLVAALGLVGNLAVVVVNSVATQRLERSKARTTLVVELVKTGNRDDALKNLKFFLDKGLLDDPDGAIRKALADKTELPVLPASSHGISEFLAGALQRITPSTAIGTLVITSTPDRGSPDSPLKVAALA